ncbi:MAG: hypothetical protein GC159_19590 [Phycisphaera sp.]|nr:hypothetical protein [Phycisphaera sp.]
MTPSNRTDIAIGTAAALRRFSETIADTPVVVGFDGFVDSIIAVVDQRADAENYTAVKTIDQLGQKFIAAAGQSSNYELVTNILKLGGNGPIMANALASIGLPVTYLGALGYPATHPAFEELERRAERCVSFTEPGYTDALEFNDGKIMLGKYAHLKDVNADHLRKVVGDEKMKAMLGRSLLLGIVNWTMLTELESIWDYLMDDILPHLDAPAAGRRRVFIDLTDPEKRTREDLLNALKHGAKFQQFADTTFGFNLKESTQAAAVLGVDTTDDPESAIEQTATRLRETLGVTGVVIHPRSAAAAAIERDGEVTSARFAGPFVKEPKLSTGAGDNFNAGFCVGQLAGMPVEQCLCCGTATSGFYVRNAGSPTLADLAGFCDDLPAPE